MKPTLDVLKAIKSDDPEGGHGAADNALVKFVRDLGYREIAEAFEAVEKWYA